MLTPAKVVVAAAAVAQFCFASYPQPHETDAVGSVLIKDCGRTAANQDGIAQCVALAEALPGKVSLPSSAAYDTGNTYWSGNQAATPRCFVSPETTKDVSVALRTLTSLQAPFTVKGGGHSYFAGASNIEDGVTVDVGKLRELKLSRDHGTISVGAGNRWIDVYQTLDPFHLSVVGGQAGDVGVSGLTLGGGISFFSGLHGWACDNVNSYEVVLSSGKVVNASPKENQDLYWALRGGGGSNFGIVTRFDLATFRQGDLWKQSLYFPGSMNQSVIHNYTNSLLTSIQADDEADGHFVLTHKAGIGYIIGPTFYHATPPPKGSDQTPAAFQPWQTMPGAVVNQTTIANLSTQAIAMDEAYGSRHSSAVATISLTSELFFQGLVPKYQRIADDLLAAAAVTNSSIAPSLIFQPITVNVMRQMQKNGGNVFGLRPNRNADNHKMIVEISVTWQDVSLDMLVEKATAHFIEQVEVEAEQQGLHTDFLYINWAGENQDVIRQYGQSTFARLQKTSRKYDPKGLLQKFWRGYFQIDRQR